MCRKTKLNNMTEDLKEGNCTSEENSEPHSRISIFCRRKSGRRIPYESKSCVCFFGGKIGKGRRFDVRFSVNIKMVILHVYLVPSEKIQTKDYCFGLTTSPDVSSSDKISLDLAEYRRNEGDSFLSSEFYLTVDKTNLVERRKIKYRILFDFYTKDGLLTRFSTEEFCCAGHKYESGKKQYSFYEKDLFVSCLNPPRGNFEYLRRPQLEIQPVCEEDTYRILRELYMMENDFSPIGNSLIFSTKSKHSPAKQHSSPPPNFLPD